MSPPRSFLKLREAHPSLALPHSWDVVVMTGAQAAITALEEEATCQGWGSLELSCQELSFQSRLPTPGHFKEEEMNFCFSYYKENLSISISEQPSCLMGKHQKYCHWNQKQRQRCPFSTINTFVLEAPANAKSGTGVRLESLRVGPHPLCQGTCGSESPTPAAFTVEGSLPN